MANKKEVKTIQWKQPLWEAMKEPLRLLVLAVIPVMITIAADLPKEYAAIAIIALRFVDSWLHNIGKITGDERMVTGLTRF